jgi:hypothetical protein
VRILSEIMFVAGLGFLSAGAFACATWAGLVVVGLSLCVAAWGWESRQSKQTPDAGKGPTQ